MTLKFTFSTNTQKNPAPLFITCGLMTSQSHAVFLDFCNPEVEESHMRYIQRCCTTFK